MILNMDGIDSSRSRRSARLNHSSNGTTDGTGIVYDVVHTGVPTRTTSTLTPTTLRNIEQTFMDYNNAAAEAQIPHQAGFVPPMAPFPVFQVAQGNSSAVGQDSSGEEDIDDDLTSSSRRRQNLTNDDDYNSSDSLSNCSWQTGQTTETPPPASMRSGGKIEEKKTPKRNMGGRRPNKPSNLSPEEEEKRKVRRERNKLAAARCRKRRVDHTNELVEEVEGLEKKKQNLQNDIQQLQTQKEDLEFLLEAHRDQCRLIGRAASPVEVKPNFSQILGIVEKIKTEPVDFELNNTASSSPKPPPPVNSNNDLFLNTPTTPLMHNNPLMSSTALSKPSHHSESVNSNARLVAFGQKPNRPSSLAVPLQITPAQSLGVAKGDFTGIPISTPSNGTFNFASLMEGGTGLTPIAGPLIPNLSSAQNRSPLDLVTPTSEPAKFVNL